jgi:hypothetical protein
VANHLKHGMMTVRPAPATAAAHDHAAHDHAMHEHGTPAGMDGMSHAAHMTMGESKPRPPVPVMTLLSFVALAAGVAIAVLSRRI